MIVDSPLAPLSDFSIFNFQFSIPIAEEVAR
jgi:hypothetical protein